MSQSNEGVRYQSKIRVGPVFETFLSWLGIPTALLFVCHHPDLPAATSMECCRFMCVLYSECGREIRQGSVSVSLAMFILVLYHLVSSRILGSQCEMTCRNSGRKQGEFRRELQSQQSPRQWDAEARPRLRFAGLFAISTSTDTPTTMTRKGTANVQEKATVTATGTDVTGSRRTLQVFFGSSIF